MLVSQVLCVSRGVHEEVPCKSYDIVAPAARVKAMLLWVQKGFRFRNLSVSDPGSKDVVSDARSKIS